MLSWPITWPFLLIMDFMGVVSHVGDLIRDDIPTLPFAPFSESDMGAEKSWVILIHGDIDYPSQLPLHVASISLMQTLVWAGFLS
jgi:hypothetical protein